MTKLQELLGKILKNRIISEKTAGTFETDKENLTETLDIFLAGNKLTSDQYAEFTELITSTTASANTAEKSQASDTTTK